MEVDPLADSLSDEEWYRVRAAQKKAKKRHFEFGVEARQARKTIDQTIELRQAYEIGRRNFLFRKNPTEEQRREWLELENQILRYLSGQQVSFNAPVVEPLAPRWQTRPDNICTGPYDIIGGPPPIIADPGPSIVHQPVVRSGMKRFPAEDCVFIAIDALNRAPSLQWGHMGGGMPEL